MGDAALADDSGDLKLYDTNDCDADAFSPAALVLYRRSDEKTNQNFYKTSGDTTAVANVGVCTTRGSVDVYACAASADVVASVTNAVVFVNGIGPLSVTVGSEAANAADFTAANDYFDTGGSTSKWVVHETAANTQMTAGKVILMDGRRYKIKTTAAGAAAGAKISLTETYAGGQI